MSINTLGIADLARALEATPDGQANRTLELVAHHCRVSDGEIAMKSGRTRNYVQLKRSGKRKLKLDDVALFAEALDVPPEIFVMTPKDANLWLLEHKAHLFVWHAA